MGGMSKVHVTYWPNEQEPQRVTMECFACETFIGRIDLTQVDAAAIRRAQPVLLALQCRCSISK